MINNQTNAAVERVVTVLVTAAVARYAAKIPGLDGVAGEISILVIAAGAGLIGWVKERAGAILARAAKLDSTSVSPAPNGGATITIHDRAQATEAREAATPAKTL